MIRKLLLTLLLFTLTACFDNSEKIIEKYRNQKLTAEKHLSIIDSLLVKKPNNSIFHYEKSRLLFNSYQWDKAKKQIEKTITLLEKEKNDGYLAKAYFISGTMYTTPVSKEKANKLLIKALHYANKVNDSLQMANIYNSLSHIQYLYQDYNQAIDYLEKTKDLYITVKDSANTSRSYNNLAILYKKISNNEKALTYNFNSLALNILLKDTVSIAKSYNNIGDVYLTKGDDKNAEKYFLKAKQLNTIKDTLNNFPERNLGNQYLHEKKYELAKEQYLLALEKEKTNNRTSVYEQIYDRLLKISLLEKDFKSALLYKQINDSINRQLTAIENKENLNLLKNQYQLVIRENELEQQKSTNTKNRIIFLFVLGLLALLALILFLRYKNQQLKLHQEKTSLELKVLRSQMNPHFIFNVLSAIQNTLLDNNPIKSAIYLSKFAKLIRQNFDFINHAKIPLKDEIDALENYINTQQLRFENRFDYHINISETIDLENTQIPPLLLQPFVENAIEHGLKNLDKKGILTISITDKGDFLCYKIKDNGLGFDVNHKKTKKEHAIDVLKKRLKLLGNQDQKSLSITSSSKGTTVAFNLKNI